MRLYRIYLAALGLAAGACLWAAWRFVGWPVSPHYLGWKHLAFFFLLGVVFSSMASRLPGEGPRRGMGFLASLLLLGPAISALLGVAAGLLHHLLRLRSGEGEGRQLRWKERPHVFGLAPSVIAIVLSGHLYIALGGEVGRARVPADLLPAAACAACLLTVEALLAETALALKRGLPLLAAWRNALLSALPLEASFAGLGVLLVLFYQQPEILLPGGHAWRPLAIVFAVLIVLIPCGLLYYSYRLYLQMRQAYERALRTLAGLVEARLSGGPRPSPREGKEGAGPPFGEKARRIAELAVAIAEQLGLAAAKVEQVRLAAYLLEVGKVGLPRGLLGRDSFASARQRRAYARHTEIASQILEPVEFLRPVAWLVRHHQERYDGLGELGLRGESIPLGARILAAAQAYVELAAEGEKDFGWPSAAEEVVARLSANSGIRFDPKVVEALAKVLYYRGLIRIPGEGRVAARGVSPSAVSHL